MRSGGHASPLPFWLSTAIIDQCSIEKAMEKMCETHLKFENEAKQAIEKLLEMEPSKNEDIRRIFNNY